MDGQEFLPVGSRDCSLTLTATYRVREVPTPICPDRLDKD
jgi:hypothetical protein